MVLAIHFSRKENFQNFLIFLDRNPRIIAGTVVNYNYEENIASEREGGLSFGTVPPIKWNRRVAEGRPRQGPFPGMGVRKIRKVFVAIERYPPSR